jgi:hypothetical protein
VSSFFNCEGRLDEKHESDKVEKSIVASREMSLDDRGSLDRISLDRNCHFSVDRKF